MSGPTALAVRSVAGELVPREAGSPPVELRLSGVTIEIYEAALEALLRPVGWRARLGPDGLFLTGEPHVLFFNVPVEVQVAAGATAEGLLRLELVRITALSGIGVPVSWVRGQLQRIAGKPGVARIEGETVDFDLREVLAHFKIDWVHLPPLQRVHLEPGRVELRYEAAGSAQGLSD